MKGRTRGLSSCCDRSLVTPVEVRSIPPDHASVLVAEKQQHPRSLYPTSVEASSYALSRYGVKYSKGTLLLFAAWISRDLFENPSRAVAETRALF